MDKTAVEALQAAYSNACMALEVKAYFYLAWAKNPHLTTLKAVKWVVDQKWIALSTMRRIMGMYPATTETHQDFEKAVNAYKAAIDKSSQQLEVVNNLFLLTEKYEKLFYVIHAAVDATIDLLTGTKTAHALRGRTNLLTNPLIGLAQDMLDYKELERRFHDLEPSTKAIDKYWYLFSEKS